MTTWRRYAVVALLVTLVSATAATLIFGREDAPALWFSAGLAYLLQLIAFAGIVAVRNRAALFVVGWAGGMVLRFGALAGVAFWVTRTHVLPPATALVSFVSFLFLLLLIEPLFLSRGTRTV